MQIIPITPNMRFLLETEQTLPERQQQELVVEWAKIFPDNPLIVMKKGTVKILELKK